MLGILLYVKIRYILLVSDLLQIEDDVSSADEGRKDILTILLYVLNAILWSIVCAKMFWGVMKKKKLFTYFLKLF